MMIGPDSPLKRLPSRLNPKQALFLDAIRFSIEMSEVAYDRLYHNLYDLSVREQQSGELPIANAILDAWSLVDAVHRLRGLLQQMPGIKLSKSYRLKIFLKATDPVEEFRNKVQHLNNEISGLSQSVSPVWGSLTWFARSDASVDTVIIGMIVSGSLALYSSPEIIIPAEEPHEKVDVVRLHVHGLTLLLSDLMTSLKKLTVAMEKNLQEQFALLEAEHGKLDYAGADLLTLTHFVPANSLDSMSIPPADPAVS